MMVELMQSVRNAKHAQIFHWRNSTKYVAIGRFVSVHILHELLFVLFSHGFYAIRDDWPPMIASMLTHLFDHI